MDYKPSPGQVWSIKEYQEDVLDVTYREEPIIPSHVDIEGESYRYVLRQPPKPFAVVEVLEDLEYGIIDIREKRIVKKVALDQNQAIEICKFWNDDVKPEHEHKWKKYYNERHVWWQCARCTKLTKEQPTEGILPYENSAMRHVGKSPFDELRTLCTSGHDLYLTSDKFGLLVKKCRDCDYSEDERGYRALPKKPEPVLGFKDYMSHVFGIFLFIWLLAMVIVGHVEFIKGLF